MLHLPYCHLVDHKHLTTIYFFRLVIFPLCIAVQQQVCLSFSLPLETHASLTLQTTTTSPILSICSTFYYLTTKSPIVFLLALRFSHPFPNGSSASFTSSLRFISVPKTLTLYDARVRFVMNCK